MVQISETEAELWQATKAALVRLRDARRAVGGPNDPAKDYAALYRERDAAAAALMRLADRVAATEKETAHA